MVRLYGLVARVARVTMPVLVFGETGSGKELVAQAIHQRSLRARGPFKALNCATIPSGLTESVLFGHERGAFTGADRQVRGIFEQADGGTIFLDEVGELSAQAQAALLRVLETKRMTRVGGVTEIELDVRVVAATHRDLHKMVEGGRFREDLLFRLDALSLQVPPLRERQEEIRPLAELFLEEARERWTAPAKVFSAEALDALDEFDWPGNVRQLRNAVERAAVACEGSLIQLEDLPEYLHHRSPAAAIEAMAAAPANDSQDDLRQRVRQFEAEIVREALQRSGGDQAQAARLLGIPRRTFSNRLRVLGLDSASALRAPMSRSSP
ncbi:MAG: sigma-54 dependent transcriptional regulator [Myxococcales bacterium]